MSSLLYTNRTLYQIVMRLLYGRSFSARYTAIADEIPAGVSVVDVCAGDGYLYLKYLKPRGLEYVALDISPPLVAWMRQHGVPAQPFDVWREVVPAADVVVMQASLYQFLPDAASVIEKLLAAARQRVIITEPIRNLASSDNPLLAWLGRRLTRPDEGSGAYSAKRFDRLSLTELFQRYSALTCLTLLPGEREMMGIFEVA